MRFKSELLIEGNVLKPGPKKFKKGMTVRDLLFLGGGFENEYHLSTTFMDTAEYITFLDDRVSPI